MFLSVSHLQRPPPYFSPTTTLYKPLSWLLHATEVMGFRCHGYGLFAFTFANVGALLESHLATRLKKWHFVKAFSSLC
jgi:hypothetical protein